MTPQQIANDLLAEHQANRKREMALQNYYDAERNAGTDPLLANERMHFFAKRLDKLHADCRLSSDEKFASDLSIIRKCMESK